MVRLFLVAATLVKVPLAGLSFKGKGKQSKKSGKKGIK
jgi:hypothetical protein